MANSEWLQDRVSELLKKNRRTAVKDGKTYTYHVPSQSTYPFQWFWDSCFHAIILSCLGRQGIHLAEEEIRSLLTSQRENGFIPHVIFWNRARASQIPWHWNQLESKPFFHTKPATSELMQPPVIAQAVERIWRKGNNKIFLEEVLPKLVRYYDWLGNNRDPDHDNLISIVSQFESGLDWSPLYDKALGLPQRPHPLALRLRGRGVNFFNKYILRFDTRRILQAGFFNVEDVLVNAVYIQGLETLASLLRELGERNQAHKMLNRAQKSQEALVEKCYDPQKGFFVSLSGKKEIHLDALTITSLMPLILKDIRRDIVESLVQKIRDPDLFATPYPLPSVATSEKAFDADSLLEGKAYLWRGSTWINTNWFLYHALKEHNYHEDAATIADASRGLVKKSGFREYYNPFTAQGLGAHNFGWSALVIDM